MLKVTEFVNGSLGGIHHEDKRFSAGRALGKEWKVPSNAQSYHEIAGCVFSVMLVVPTKGKEC